MTELTRAEMERLIDACGDAEGELFFELMGLPDAARYRQALVGCKAFRLNRGELPPRMELSGTLVVLQGKLIRYDPTSYTSGRVPTGEEEDLELIQMYAQWTGLQGVRPTEDAIALENDTVVLEVKQEVLRTLLFGVSSSFSVAFFAPMVQACPAIADIKPEDLGNIIKAAKFYFYKDEQPIVTQGEYGSTMFFLLQGNAGPAGAVGQFQIKKGEFFGELAVLTAQPRMSTIVALGECLAMECNRIVFGDLRKKSKNFKEVVEKSYRERLMQGLLRSTPLFAGLEDAELTQIASIGTLESYVPYEPVFFQGDPADAFYIVLNGTMTVVEERADGVTPIAWVGQNSSIGEMGLLPEISGTDRRGQTVTSLQRVDAVRFSAEDFHGLLSRNRALRTRIVDTARRRYEENLKRGVDENRRNRLAWMFETEHLAGNWVLAVDMNDCIRCGNCVSACEATHADGISRFFWSDMRQSEDVMPAVRLSNSCQHCEFALCMNVCPTTAIERRDREATVYIDYNKCIRCGKCADPSQGCPYGSIHIMPAEEVNPQASQPLLQQIMRFFQKKPAEGAPTEGKQSKQGSRYPVKCDLCYTLPHQSCVKHCPTGAVFRLDGGIQFGKALNEPVRVGANANRPSGNTIPMY
ncbi:MAG: cyclic nucleotide-binding domain-containing protein, partial [Armatimonadetes bacterium]|nr:cyclic nucleotide-binding domain-containing protein [Armatimonadota bacterium]